MGGNPEQGASPERQLGPRSLSFEQSYGRLLVGDAEPESGGVVQAYELILDPRDQRERRGLLVSFCLSAASSGYAHALAPVSLPGVGYRDSEGERPLTAVYFFLTPPAQPESTTR